MVFTGFAIGLDGDKRQEGTLRSAAGVGSVDSGKGPSVWPRNQGRGASAFDAKRATPDGELKGCRNDRRERGCAATATNRALGCVSARPCSGRDYVRRIISYRSRRRTRAASDENGIPALRGT